MYSFYYLRKLSVVDIIVYKKIAINLELVPLTFVREKSTYEKI